MDRYMTLLEISSLWEADTRTIQGLCRNGKIEGAIKRAGSWFIPMDAPNPLKNNSKLNGKRHHFIGTKGKVFDSAIELFSSKGFENVSLRDLGDYVGITQSTIYNHFSSKQEILETMYDYFSENFDNNQVPIKKMKLLLKKGAKEEFCAALMFNFESKDKTMWMRMTFIAKIIYMRIYHDDRAQRIFLNLMNADSEDYLTEILEYGVSIGTLKEFDIPAYIKLLIGQRHIIGIKAFADPDYELQYASSEEKRMIKMCTDIIPFVTKD